MKFLRGKTEDAYQLASMQARIFEKSAEKEIPSYFFIQDFMFSNDAKGLDDLSFLTSGSSELEIYLNIINNLKRKTGTIYPSEIMHWIGFFYRYASYLSGLSSITIFKKISPQYLNKIYPLYHGLDIVKAVEMVFDDLGINNSSPLEKFIDLYKTKKIIL